MKPNNNKEFYEVARKSYIKMHKILMEELTYYLEYFTKQEAESFDSVQLGLFLNTIKEASIEFINELNELNNQAYHRFLRGLDLE